MCVQPGSTGKRKRDENDINNNINDKRENDPIKDLYLAKKVKGSPKFHDVYTRDGRRLGKGGFSQVSIWKITTIRIIFKIKDIVAVKQKEHSRLHLEVKKDSNDVDLDDNTSFYIISPRNKKLPPLKSISAFWGAW